MQRANAGTDSRSVSQGFNPHMALSFATALSLGAESLYEVMDIKLLKEMKAQDRAFRPERGLSPGFEAL
jgi:uncharacterized protein (DUF2344 family)